MARTATVRGSMSFEGVLERYFRFAEWGTTMGREMMAGLTTFLVMAYIIFVNPQILTSTQSEVSAGAITTATCLVAGIMSIVMGIYTNRAFAIAPGMGLNAVVAFSLIAGEGLTYGEAMGVIVAEGLLITLLVLTGVRSRVMTAIDVDLRRAIAVGIGVFILFIGLVDAGIVVQGAGTPVALNPNAGWTVLVAVFGIVLTVGLTARGVRMSLLLGIIFTTVLAIIVNDWQGGLWSGGAAEVPSDWVASPATESLFLVSFDFVSSLGFLAALAVVISIGLSDFFDTMGTFTGVGQQAGYLEDGNLPDAKKPLLVDSLAAVAGGASGASSATSYIESAAGVSVGGRTGFTVVVTGLLFLLAIPFWPIVGAVPVEATAAALILVGFMMMRNVIGKIDFTRLEQAFPAAAVIFGMPLTFSITNGIGFGVVSYVLIRVFQGKARELNPFLLGIAGVFALYFFREYLFGVTA